MSGPYDEAEHALEDVPASPPGTLLTVTALERESHGRRYRVHLEGRPALSLDPEVLATSGLRTGMQVDAARLEALHEADLRKQAIDAALNLLAIRPRSETEVRTRLTRRGLPDDAIDAAIARLRELGYLDDPTFARLWTESRGQARGRHVIRRELRAKGIDQETVDAAVADLSEIDAARRAAEKKARSLRGLEYQVFRNRLSGFLLRRGFSYETVKSVTDACWAARGEPIPDEEPIE